MKHLTLAFFVSPHGFGHAARASAIMQAIQRRHPHCHIQVHTQVPAWFFQQTLTGSWRYIDYCCDVGFAQNGPLQMDLTGTVAALEQLLPMTTAALQQQVEAIAQCDAVLADIAPLALHIAQAAQRPSILIENFRWSDLYRHASLQHPALQAWAAKMATLEKLADHRLYSLPVGSVGDRGEHTNPISRPTTAPLAATRRKMRAQLGLQPHEKLILLSMGGISGGQNPVTPFVEPGNTSGNRHKLPDHWRLLAAQSYQLANAPKGVQWYSPSEFYHPDLVAAADLVILKLGYSTVAECWANHTPMLYLGREDFAESPVLQAFVEQGCLCEAIKSASLANGTWLPVAEKLLAKTRQDDQRVNGAEQAAQIILRHLDAK